LALNNAVKQLYNGYNFNGQDIYNPWSILNYAKKRELIPYWVNTSSNTLIKKLLAAAPPDFTDNYHQLIKNRETIITANLETAYIEGPDTATLWGLLINTGYLTVTEKINIDNIVVKIPNDEVKRELRQMFAEQTRMGTSNLNFMILCLSNGDIEGFTNVYQKIVLNCTSYYDAKENAYHMLCLGMIMGLDHYYKITSNQEAGLGRYDIRMESLRPGHPHIIIEFKQDEDTEKSKKQALNQIKDMKYYAGLDGKVLCLGIAHNKKQCEILSEEIFVQGNEICSAQVQTKEKRSNPRDAR
jgi:hypothetical protein